MWNLQKRSWFIKLSTNVQKENLWGKKSFLKHVIKCKNSLCEWWLTYSRCVCLCVCVCTWKHMTLWGPITFPTNRLRTFWSEDNLSGPDNLINKLWSKHWSRKAAYESGLGKAEGIGLGHGMEYELKSSYVSLVECNNCLCLAACASIWPFFWESWETGQFK